MTKLLIITAFFLILILPYTADAENYGLAMHGTPKYTAQSKNLSYVNKEAPKSGNVKIASIGSFDTINPFSIKGVAAEGLPLVYDRLMQRVWDEPFSVYPLIAESYSVAPDRSWISFNINPNAKFHNQSPITSDDVLFSFDTLKEFGRPNMRRVYKLVKKAEKTGPLSVKFTLFDNHDHETIMIIAMMPVLSKSWWSKRNFDSNITEIPLVNGPYKIKEINTGRNITYELVKNYWAKDLLVNAGQYNFNQITYEYFRDDTIALESFKRGDLDIRREWDINKWETSYPEVVQSTKIKKLEILHQRPERAHAMIFNTRRPPFDDLSVRKALSLAFDENWVSKNFYHSKFKRIESYFPNSSLDGSGPIGNELVDLLKQQESNLPSEIFQKSFKISDIRSERVRFQEANTLLKKAGWVVESGKRINASSKKPFSFELILSSPSEEKIALTYKSGLERLGIDMKIRFLDSATFQNRKSNYEYDMMMFFWQNTLSPGTEQNLYWSCMSASQEAQFNFAGICHPALDYSISKISNAKTYDELKIYAQAIDRILLAQYISIPLFYRGSDYIALKESIQIPEVIPLYGLVMETLWMQPVNQDKASP